MKATVLDMRRNPRKILEAIERNEKITLSMRGNEIAEIVPKKRTNPASIAEDPAVGLWADRTDLKRPAHYVRTLRAGRFDAV